MVSTTELSELLKLPVLVEHYFEHKEKCPKMSVIDFLVLHYNDHLKDHPTDHDYAQDQKLPFMVHTQTLSFNFISPQPIVIEFETTSLTQIKDKIMITNDSDLGNTFHSFIWQPPKFC